MYKIKILLTKKKIFFGEQSRVIEDKFRIPKIKNREVCKMCID